MAYEILDTSLRFNMMVNLHSTDTDNMEELVKRKLSYLIVRELIFYTVNSSPSVARIKGTPNFSLSSKIEGILGTT